MGHGGRNRRRADAGGPSALTDTAGLYTFDGVTVGAVRVSAVLKADWHLSPGRPGAMTVSVNHEDPVVADFAVFTPTLGSISGRLWNDADGNGSIGASEGALTGWTAFIDQNADGVANAGEPAAVSDFAGMYTINDVPVGSTVVREVPAAGWSLTSS